MKRRDFVGLTGLAAGALFLPGFPSFGEVVDPARLLEPGVVSCSRWRPDPSREPGPEVPHFSGVALVTGDE